MIKEIINVLMLMRECCNGMHVFFIEFTLYKDVQSLQGMR